MAHGSTLMASDRPLNEPVVSVVLPVRNGERWIRSCLESVASQTFHDFEIVLVDDLCSDRSVDIALAMDLPQLRIVRGPGMGLARALALGVEEARGEFIARLDVDDVAEPTRLAEQVKAFLDEPALVVVGSAAIQINDQDEVVGRIRVPETDRTIRINSVLFNPFIHSSTMVRKATVVEAGNYWAPSNEPYPEDFDLWLRMLKCGKAHNLQAPLVRYRKSDNSLMSMNSDLIRMRTAEICVHSALERFDERIVPPEKAHLLGFFHWRTNRVSPPDAWRLTLMLMRIRRSFGVRDADVDLAPSTFLKPFAWMFLKGSINSPTKEGMGCA